MRTAVVAIYVDPDFFPPTINAILNLADLFDDVTVICRNNSVRDYPYPRNVRLKKIGNRTPVREMEKQAGWKKAFYFFKFIRAIQISTRDKKAELVLLYDPLALFAFYLVRYTVKSKKIWYHNHDMPDRSKRSLRSIGGLAAKVEHRAIKAINFFSLPDEQRLKYYPDIPPDLPVFIMPNYPSLKVYPSQKKYISSNDPVYIIYQGFIGEGHGLEALMGVMQEKISDTDLYLVLKGSVSSSYKLSINNLAKKLEISSRIIWKDIGPYADLPAVTSSCHIGIGINKKVDNVSLTQGTASNKIYEYIACGLPVILYDAEQFTRILKDYNWAFFTDGTKHSIREQIEAVLPNLRVLGVSARRTFEESLNFEMHFQPIFQSIMKAS